MASTTHPNLKLSDTQLVLLSAASQRDDHLLIPSETIKGGALAAALQALLRRGLIETVGGSCDLTDPPLDKAHQPCRTKITRAGLDALGLTADASDEAAPNDGAVPSSMPAASRSQGRTTAAGPAPQTRRAGSPIDPTPRTGTKRALIIGLLSREDGATLDDLIGATGWLPHTTRAALTGLRRNGYMLDKSKDAHGRTVYRIAHRPEPARVEQAAS